MPISLYSFSIPFVFEILARIQFGEDASFLPDKNVSCRHNIFVPLRFLRRHSPGVPGRAWGRVMIRCMTSQSLTWGPGCTGGNWRDGGRRRLYSMRGPGPVTVLKPPMTDLI